MDTRRKILGSSTRNVMSTFKLRRATPNPIVPKILLDTNAFKFAAKGPLSFIPVNRKTRNWYGRVTGFQRYDIGYVNRNEKIGNPELKREVDLLPLIAQIAKEGGFELLAHP